LKQEMERTLLLRILYSLLLGVEELELFLSCDGLKPKKCLPPQ